MAFFKYPSAVDLQPAERAALVRLSICLILFPPVFLQFYDNMG